MTGTISSSIVFRPIIYGGRPDIVVARIRITPRLSGEEVLRAGDISKDIPLTFDASGGVSNTIYATIRINSNSQALLVPNGSVSSAIVIQPSINGGTPDLLIGNINISPLIYGAINNQGTVDSTVKVISNIQARQRQSTGTISRQIRISRVISGHVDNISTISSPINITASSTNRARSYLSVGLPVPTSFRHGKVAGVVRISSSFTLVAQPAQGIIRIPIIPRAFLVGNLTNITGRISASIIFKASVTSNGIQVNKATPYTVIGKSVNGVEVIKTVPVVVLSQGLGNLVSKSVVYAVIAPEVGSVSNYGYQAIFFQ